MIENPRSNVRRALSLALLAALAACSSDSTSPNDPGPPPELPPLTSMSGDFSIFGSPGAQHGEFAPQANSTSLNFGNAAIRVLAAQVATVVALAVPVTTFAAAANSTPTFEDDDRWHWRFTHGPGWSHLRGPPQRSGAG